MAKKALPPIQDTVPEVFILESLSFDDEEEQRYEGGILCDILRLCGKSPKYFYFRTEAELEELVKIFRRSQYRYLHLSAHGNGEGIATTLGSITSERFARIFRGHLKNRRLFLSACSSGNAGFFEAIYNANKGIYSIAAPATDIEFRKAAALWAAFYVKLFSLGDTGMKTRQIKEALSRICGLFETPCYFGYHNAKKDTWVEETIAPAEAPTAPAPGQATKDAD